MSHHEPLSSLGSVHWDDVPQQELKSYLDGIFTEAQTVIESIPSTALAQNDNTTASLDGLSPSGVKQQSPAAAEQSQQLRKEWKECKINAKDNPLGVNVYKLSSKDGKGAWFARTSVHEGLTFDTWKKGLDKEFGETMKVQDGPGSGNIRGIGADKRVEHHVVEDSMGEVQVYQLSAQFPGPTSPRDFTTLLLTRDFHRTTPDDPRPVRQYMIVSKPVEHPECPPRSGIIRGHYESVELIREIPLSPTTTKKAKSAIDLTAADKTHSSVLKESASDGARPGPADEGTQVSTTIEWLMVKRSDPGGTVPRFMVEKGTPPGIVGDAGKFLKWLTALASDEGEVDATPTDKAETAEAPDLATRPKKVQLPAELSSNTEKAHEQLRNGPALEAEASSNSGLYGMISGALEAASNVVAGGIRQQPLGEESSGLSASSSTLPAMEDHHTSDSESDDSSIRSFTSALEMTASQEQRQNLGDDLAGQHDEQSFGSHSEEKELKRLQEKRRKLEEKAKKTQERLEHKRQGDKEKDAAALAKAREKHEKELAKQEAKYRRELKKLEEKREHEDRKVEQRRRKAAEREEKHKLAVELESVKSERDLALKKIELLESQVGELQAQNTKLVSKFGKTGLLSGNGSASSSHKDLSKGHKASSSLSAL